MSKRYTLTEEEVEIITSSLEQEIKSVGTLGYLVIKIGKDKINIIIEKLNGDRE